MRNLIIIIVCSTAIADTAPRSGDVFAEYPWVAEGKLYLAVTGAGTYGDAYPVQGNLPLNHDVALTNATRAEALVEFTVNHQGPRMHYVKVNAGNWVALPYPPLLPQPGTAFDYNQACVDVPLTDFKQGTGNTFQLRVEGSDYTMVWGVAFRIYYDPAKKTHPTGRVLTPLSGGSLAEYTDLTAEASSPNGFIKRVDYIGWYEDVCYEGDGVYKKWHYNYDHARMIHQLAFVAIPTPAIKIADFKARLNSQWIPDQPKDSMKIMARITDSLGIMYLTPANDRISLVRPILSVELCKPYDQPVAWSCRYDDQCPLSEHFDIKGDPKKITGAQYCVGSWNGFNTRGFTINGTRLGGDSLIGSASVYNFARNAITPLTVLRQGQNTMATISRQPDPPGGHTHGFMILWPGVMVLLQYRTPTAVIPAGPSLPARTEGIRTTGTTVPGAVYRLDGSKIAAFSTRQPRVGLTTPFSYILLAADRNGAHCRRLMTVR